MRIRYFVILLLLMMTGCAKEQFSEQNGIRTFDCFTVKMEEDPVTKAHIEATGAVKWDVGDRIGVYSDIQGPVEFTRGDDGRFYGETVSGTKFYAFYPWDSFQYDVENPLTLKIVPSVFWGGGVMSSPMVAVTQNNTLQFKQAVGLLHFHMKGSKHLGNLCLYSNDSTTKINGEGLVDLSQDMPVLYMNPETTWSSFSVIVDQNNADRGEWDVYFPLPPLTLPEGFTLLIDCTDPTTSENYSLERTLSKETRLERAGMKSFSTIDVDDMVQEKIQEDNMVPPDDEIWYFTVNKEPLVGLSETSFDQGVISNTYENGKGVVKLTGALKVVKQLAFDNSWNLKYLYLPDCVEVIEDQAFLGGEIESLYIPASLKTYSGKVFSGCIVRRFSGDERVQNNGRFVTEEGRIRLIAASRDNSLTIPGIYEAIDDYAMWAKAPELEHLIIEEGITTIGMYAFSGGRSLKTVRLPQTMSNPAGAVFDYCDQISRFEGPGKFVSFDGRTLYRYVSLDDQQDRLKFIMNIAKAGLAEYTVEEDVDGLDPESFCRANGLNTITILNPHVYVTSDTFDECYNLERILGPGATPDGRCFVGTGSIIECGYEKLKLLVFAGKGIEEYIVDGSCKEIGNGVFAFWENLKEVVIPDGVSRLGHSAFWGCSGLETVTLSATLAHIGNDAFALCPKLKNIYLRSPIPPALENLSNNPDASLGIMGSISDLAIYVPESAVDVYKTTAPWSSYASSIKGTKYELDFYVSSDYSMDGNVSQLQKATCGAGINMVLMGDAFSDRQIADGTYATVMNNAMEDFFSEEPYKSFRDHFNVYSVDVVSMTELYQEETALETYYGDGTFVGGNDDKTFEYARKALTDAQMDEAMVIVMLNRDYYAGTCYMYYTGAEGDYGQGPAIAYFPTSSDAATFAGLVSHEAGGHGFAKLADEYSYEGSIPDDEAQGYKDKFPLGWWKNIDFTDDLSQVKWAQFLSDERYSNEGLGVYEGGCTYALGVWHPTVQSIMNLNTGGFNAPSRYAIWYRIGKLAYGDDWAGSYEDFVAYDAVNRQQPAASARHRSYVEKQLPPLAPPVVVSRDWRDAIK